MVGFSVVRSMYLPAALRGVEASRCWLCRQSATSFGSSIYRVVWSRRQPWLSVGAQVLILLDGPTGCEPCFLGSSLVSGSAGAFVRYLAPRGLRQVGRAYRLLEMVGDGCPGHGPIHLLSASAAEIGFADGTL